VELGTGAWWCPWDGGEEDVLPGTDSQYWSTAAVPGAAAHVLAAAAGAAERSPSISANAPILRVIERWT
jgi:hypothetical protein